MAKNVVHAPTRVVPLTAPSALTSGQRFKSGSLVAVAMTDAANGDKVSSALDGVFSFVKSGEAFTEGQAVYHSPATSALQAANSTTYTRCGYAIEAASSSATAVAVAFNHPAP